MKNIKYLLVIFLSLITSLVFAQAQCPIEAEKTSLQLVAEQWVTTSTAEVTIGIDATLDKSGLTQIRSEILAKLDSLAKNADWHLTIFNRSQNESGLEQLHVEAQARLPEVALNDLRDKAKKNSKPGITFNVINIDFTPSLAEFETARAELRSTLYLEAKAEADRLNKVFPDASYAVHSIDIQTAQVPVPIAPMNMTFRVGGAAKATDSAEVGAIGVSSKIQVTAVVELTTQTSDSVQKSKVI